MPGHHIQPVCRTQLELNLVTVDFCHHFLEKQLLFVLVERKREGGEPFSAVGIREDSVGAAGGGGVKRGLRGRGVTFLWR